ncbi:MAG: adenylyltransferase/cytidyltransferase family protein, partial [Thermodesulfobacteriota bacterium]
MGTDFKSVPTGGEHGMKKILSWEALKIEVERRRRQGEKIAFTNGCFDILHVGHVRYLREARKRGDLLILALNSDVSVRAIKGERRPLLPEQLVEEQQQQQLQQLVVLLLVEPELQHPRRHRRVAGGLPEAEPDGCSDLHHHAHGDAARAGGAHPDGRREGGPL